MKRSGGITAAAVVLIVASALACFTSFFALLAASLLRHLQSATSPGAAAKAIALFSALLAVSIWAIVTGIGLLRLRRWAWYCILAISALLIAAGIPGIFTLRRLIRATTGVPTVAAPGFIGLQYAGIAISSGVPLALGIWWLTLFLRRSARAQFPAKPPAQPVAARDLQPISQPQIPAPSQAATAAASEQPAAAAYIPPPESPRSTLSSRRPASITVIAVLLILGGAFFPLMFFYPRNWRMMLLFGNLLAGNKALAVGGIWAAVGLALGIGLLLLQPWARTGTILYCLFGFASGVISARAVPRVMEATQKALKLPEPAMKIPAGFQHAITILGILFTAAIYVAALYFLITRAYAFRKPPVAPPSSQALDANAGAPSPQSGLAP